MSVATSPEGTPGAPIIEASGLSRSYGEKRVIYELDLTVGADDFLLVTGPNGSGKSTLLGLLAGLLAPTAGSLSVGVKRGEIGLLAHESLLYNELTPLENLELYGRLYRVPERRERIGMLLERYGLWDVRHERVSSFSRGMTQRLAFCRTLLHDPKLVLLDEPYASLDSSAAEIVDRELDALRAEATVVVSTHDPNRLSGMATMTVAFA